MLKWAQNKSLINMFEVGFIMLLFIVPLWLVYLFKIIIRLLSVSMQSVLYNLPEKCSATHMRSSFCQAVSFIHVPNVVSIFVTFLGLIRDLIRHSEGEQNNRRFTFVPMVHNVCVVFRKLTLSLCRFLQELHSRVLYR